MEKSFRTVCVTKTMKMVAVLLALLALFPSTNAVDLGLFYNYGQGSLDNILSPGDDKSSMEITLANPVVFYNISYTSIYVNTNGHISLGQSFPEYFPDRKIPMGQDPPFIAAYLADVDTGSRGTVYYRTTDEQEMLSRAASDIRQHFSGFETYMPSLLVIATWEDVGYYNRRFDKLNTFQIVLATDGRNSFALFHYADRGIQWKQSDGKFNPYRKDMMPQAGFDWGNFGLYYTLEGSGVTGDFVRGSNVDIPGVWMFQIGDLGNQNVRSADLQAGGVTVFEVETEVETSQDTNYCDAGASTCHANARCINYSDSFCCSCIEPSFGNGVSCIKPSKRGYQSFEGYVNGRVNGIDLGNRIRMHTYGYQDGRAYTTFSRVPTELATGFETLTFLGGIGGFLLGPRKNPTLYNGFMITGAKFNYSTTITYTQRNGQTNVLRVQQVYKGYFQEDHIRVSTNLDGSFPDFDYNTPISFEQYVETFRKTAPGVLKSSTTRPYRAGGVPQRYKWENTIEYEECPERASQSYEIHLNVTRFHAHILNWNSTDLKKPRFATETAIVTSAGDSSPCARAAGVCHQKAACVPRGQFDFTCTCMAGYTGDGRICTDINECEYNNPCGPNARCYNVMGAYQCQCDSGFIKGENNTCRAKNCKEADLCSDNADCIYDYALRQYVCECRDEFSGDGYTCESGMAGFSSCDACHRQAQCTSDESTGRFFCECRAGFTGDGTRCDYIETCRSCSRYASCDFDSSIGDYKCTCRRGYKGDGLRCELRDCREDESMCASEGGICYLNRRSNVSRCHCNYGYVGDGFECRRRECKSDSECDQSAQCVVEGQIRTCRCNDGYHGDGWRCRQNRPSPTIRCQGGCDANAQCVRDQSGRYRCQCNNGYEGDGRRCREVNNCRRDPRICSQYGRCVRGRDGGYMCVCRSGYTGDGVNCRRSYRDDRGDSLIYAQGSKIMRVYADGRNGQGRIVAYDPRMLAVGVDVDCVESDIYWTDAAQGVIKKSKIDGSEMQNVVNGMKSPEGIAIDFVARNMFFTDSEMDSLMVAKLNGSDVKTLVNTEMANPRAIALDVNNGVIYWTDWNRNLPQIERINMDGTERDVLVEDDIGLPNGLAFDPYSQILCWGDAGTKRIECIRSDGASRQVVLRKSMYPFDIAMLNDVIYWTDWNMGDRIQNVVRNGTEKAALTPTRGGNGRTYGITVVRDRCPRARNSCGQNNGGCKYLCLPTAHGGHTCECPDGMDPRVCQQ